MFMLTAGFSGLHDRSVACMPIPWEGNTNLSQECPPVAGGVDEAGTVDEDEWQNAGNAG